MIRKLEVRVDPETSDGYHTFTELYDHRHWLFICLANRMKRTAWKSWRHDDGTMFTGMFIAGIETPEGHITYHMPRKLYKELKIRSLEYAPKWDGHTPADVIIRLSKLPKR